MRRIVYIPLAPPAALPTTPEQQDSESISTIVERHDLTPMVHFTTWDGYAVVSMAEGGIGIRILPRLMLKRILCREIGIALKSGKTASLAVSRFTEHLQYRKNTARGISPAGDALQSRASRSARGYIV